MKAKKILILLLLFVPVLLNAQKSLGYFIGYDEVPEGFKERYFSKNTHNFFPMHVGDIWQYSQYLPFEDTTHIFSFTIRKDTVVNGKQYFFRDEFCNEYYRSDDSLDIEYILDEGDYDGDSLFYEDLISENLSFPVYETYSVFSCWGEDPRYVIEEGWYIIDDDTLFARRVFSIGAEILYVQNYWIMAFIPEQSPTVVLTGAIIDGVQYGTIINDVSDEEELPVKFSLSQNYPNPFSKGAGGNPTTTIKYSIPFVIARSGEAATWQSPVNVTLTVYDILGRKVATLVNERKTPGNYSVKFNAFNLPSGIYFYTLRAGNFSTTKKMILMK